MQFNFLNIIALLITTASSALADLAADVRQLTCRLTRIVWAQAVDQQNNKRVFFGNAWFKPQRHPVPPACSI